MHHPQRESTMLRDSRHWLLARVHHIPPATSAALIRGVFLESKLIGPPETEYCVGLHGQPRNDNRAVARGRAQRRQAWLQVMKLLMPMRASQVMAKTGFRGFHQHYDRRLAAGFRDAGFRSWFSLMTLDRPRSWTDRFLCLKHILANMGLLNKNQDINFIKDSYILPCALLRAPFDDFVENGNAAALA